MSKDKLLAVLFSLLILGGCASNKNVDQQTAQSNDPRDPLESINRTMWDFNYDILDKYVLRPVTVVYVDYMPQFARTGLLNVALNLEEPANTVNNLLQGKLDGTFISLGRFVINTTIGLLGSIDVASEMGLQRKDEEFGEVLGKWGAGTGPFLMVPVLGPNDIRSGVGDYVDASYFPLDGLNIYFTILRGGIKALETRATLIQQEQMLNDSPDPYAFVKGAYFQHLEFKVQDGHVEQTEAEMQIDEDIDAYLDDL